MQMSEDTSKKILVINGSPKREKSFTMTATKAFVGGMMKERESTVEYIITADMNIKPCRGCLSCWGRTEGECVIKDDDMGLLTEKLKEADFVIHSYPLYFFGMPGAFKTFIDRMLGMFETYKGFMPAPDEGLSHRFRDSDKEQRFAVISSCGFSEGEEVFAPLRGQYDLIYGRGNYTAIFCPQIKALVEAGSTHRLAAFTEKAEQAGRMFMRQGFLDDETTAELSKPWFSKKTYRLLAERFWEEQKAGGKNS